MTAPTRRHALYGAEADAKGISIPDANLTIPTIILSGS